METVVLAPTASGRGSNFPNFPNFQGIRNGRKFGLHRCHFGMGRVVAERRRGRETAALIGGYLRTEEDPVKEEAGADEFADNSITEEELLLAARRAFTFPSACVDGEIEDAKVADRIMAARGLLEHAAKVPRLFNDLLTGVVELSDEDIGLIATALE
jgi:hypothetical protein